MSDQIPSPEPMQPYQSAQPLQPPPAQPLQPYQPPQQYQPHQSAPTPASYAPQYVVTAKSKFVAALLAFFLGTWGFHNFYLGYNGRGLVQLVIGFLGYVTAFILIGFLLLVPLAIWVFVEFLMLLFAKQGRYARGANGMPLS